MAMLYGQAKSDYTMPRVKWYQRLMCFFGFHGKGRWFIEIVDVRYASHAIDNRQFYGCERCKKELPEVLTSK